MLLLAVFAVVAIGCGSPPTADSPATAGAAPDAAADPTVILVSLDGFRWDYRSLAETPHLDALAARGVHAERLIPAFPSKTFPCHYSTVTGLYPGHHGIVSNNMRDPGWEGDFRLGTAELLESRWWGGEPIWNTAQRQGLVSASFFWPGSDVLIDGGRPRYYYTYDGSIPFEDRVAQVLAWLDLPAGERPSFITLYFAEPNEAAHRFGPEAPEALAAAGRVDAMIGLLVDGLRQRGVLESTDIVVAADHGMAQMSEERVIVLDDYIELVPGELFEAGALLQIYPAEGREAEILAALQGAHPHLAVWHRDELPERFRLRGSPRVAPIVGVPDVGWSVETRAAVEGSRGRFLLGNHGGDPYHPDMGGIFIAAGPSFAEGARVPAFENVEIYNLLAHALGIEPAPNDGDLSRVPGILR
jgi:predicted AlkP superfamily pyrophosphatase or phosphodiesterase